jgi:hypothetical protein
LLDADPQASEMMSQVPLASAQQGLQDPPYFSDHSMQYPTFDVYQGQLGRSSLQSHTWPGGLQQPVNSHLAPQMHERIGLSSLSSASPFQDGTSSQTIPGDMAIHERHTPAPQTHQPHLGDDAFPGCPQTVSLFQPDYSAIPFDFQSGQSDSGHLFTQPTYAGQIQNIDFSGVPLQGVYMDGAQTAFDGNQCTCGGGHQCADCLELSRLLTMAENEALTSDTGVEGL